MGIRSFDSFDDMMEYLQHQMRSADDNVQEWQTEIQPGDYFLRSSHGINIYGTVLKEEEPREQHLQHYRLCRCYSIACPEGEIGDVHVSTIEQILTEADFDHAKDNKWNP